MVLTLVSCCRSYASERVTRADQEFADNENKDQTGYVAFVKALRTQFATDKSKQYYISAAPQCPLPDASIPVDAMKIMDFVVSVFPTPMLIWAIVVMSCLS